MEQWSTQTYSLKSILEKRYLEFIIKKYDIDTNNVIGNTTKEKIDSIIYEIEDANYTLLENYIDYNKKILFKILDRILGNSKKLLHPANNKRTYLFDCNNIIFFNFLLDSYEEKLPDMQKLIAGKFSRVSFEFRELLCRGLQELATNKNTSLTIDFINKRVSLIFDMEFERTINVIEDLKAALDRYSMDIYGKDDFLGIYLTVQQVTQTLLNCIPTTSERNCNLPDIDFSEVEKQLKLSISEAKKRSERVKKSWETRREK